MSRVIDYAWGRPSIEALRTAGAVAVCRYLSWLPNDKCLSRGEADRLRAAGIDIVSNWEYYGDWLHDYSGGRRTGTLHALEADDQHVDCGGPPDRPIYFSTDFAPTAGQLPTVADYYRGVADVIGLERTGAYGGVGTIRYLFDQRLIRWGWQTYAWSGQPTQWDARAQLRQVRNGVQVGGVDCDLNDTAVDDFGQWGYDMAGELADQALKALDGRNALGDVYSRLMFGTSEVDGAYRSDASVAGLYKLLKELGGGASVALTAEDRADIAAQVLAQMPKIPTAAEIAEELARRIGNG